MRDFSLYVSFAVIAVFVPMLLAGRPAPDVLRRRYIMAVAAAILASVFTVRVTQLPVIWSAVSATPGSMAMRDALSAFMLAIAAGTLLYSLGNLFFGLGIEARRS